ncbi:hypothetical protein Gorai_019252, partial [Gossypium raimondii]|nr:hypothetical protein [Gossypium raimondii]
NLPTGFQSVQVLNLYSNLIDGSLPSNFGGYNLRYLNVSYNRLFGEIPPQFTHKIPGIIVKDIVGIGFVIMVFLLAYKLKRKKRVEATMKQKAKIAKDNWSITSLSLESRGFTRWSCLRKRGEYEEKSDTREDQSESKSRDNQRKKENEHEKKGTLVTVDGEKQLELNTLLKTSTFILGATGSSKMYKIVLEDRTSLAVRMICKNNVDQFRDFEN